MVGSGSCARRPARGAGIRLGKDYLDIERVGSASPTPQAARAFGAALARMHDAGAKYFGSAPDGYNGTCYFGPLQDPVKMDTRRVDRPDQLFR